MPLKDIDQQLSRALLRDIGESLRAGLPQGELPSKLRVQLQRLQRAEDQAARTNAGGEPHQKTTLQKLLSRTRWRAGMR